MDHSYLRVDDILRNQAPNSLQSCLFLNADAQKRVEEMERERRKLDRQLDLAQEKTKRANLGQEVLEAKMRVRSFVIGSKMAQYV